MDSSVMGGGGGLLSSSTAGILELQSSIHLNERGHLGHPQVNPHLQAMNAVRNFESDHPIRLMENKGFSAKNCSKGKGIVMNAIAATTGNPTNNCNNNTSEEDEPSFTEDGNDVHFNGVKGKKGSPWQRMKWNDNMVRLLITVVSYVGEDGVPEGGDGMKRKSGVLQKKGKWKTISKIMMQRGCNVSPQQCEDKFNDLNKRYKRLNEILGRGTTCRVVESPVLLDSMPQLSPKIKDDVRKILSSKHLFYQEMCAYHNGQRIPNSQDFDLQGYSLPAAVYLKDGNNFEGEEDDENDECDDDELDDEDHNNKDKDVDKMGEFSKRRKMNEEGGIVWAQPVGPEIFGAEMSEMLQDSTKSPWEQRDWIKIRTLQLQEQKVSFQAQAFELEKRRLKWQKFCSKKDRELERLRLDNERMRLENQRMELQLRQKELEIDRKMSETSLNHVSIGLDRLQEKDQIELGRLQ